LLRKSSNGFPDIPRVGESDLSRRLHKIFDRAHISEALIYMVVGVMGYLLLFQEKHIDSIVLQSITTTPMLIGKISPNIGKMLMLITLFFAVPLNMLPAR
jgi:hypothetical protein